MKILKSRVARAIIVELIDAALVKAERKVVDCVCSQLGDVETNKNSRDLVNVVSSAFLFINPEQVYDEMIDRV